MSVRATDCSPLVPQPSAAEAAWLRKLAASVSPCDFVIGVSGRRDDDEPVVYCEKDGTWWAGRYIGAISFEGQRLTIQPRFGLATLRSWLFEATAVVLAESPGQLREDDSFITQLLATVWAQRFVETARHGLPALSCDEAHRGMSVRGRLDVRASIRLFAAGGKEVVSVRTIKNLDHAASDAIVAAYSVLRRWAPDEKWLPQRAKELIPHLIAVTSARPRVPTKAELDRIRYTPITAGFASFAELSRQIANRRGLSTEVDASGETNGVLLDVAELWELYVLNVLRKAAAPLLVKHGTREPDVSKKLLRSEVNGRALGTLIPDAVVYRHGDVKCVVDAKYKSIYPSFTAPQGPQREDLYQMAAYLARYRSSSDGPSWGLLAYPAQLDRADISPAESYSPWRLDRATQVVFAALPHDGAAAAARLRSWIERL
jgi:5-methylcytosine-specific restriction enzyme subunit McrC